jgi:hypothetical protein
VAARPSAVVSWGSGRAASRWRHCSPSWQRIRAGRCYFAPHQIATRAHMLRRGSYIGGGGGSTQGDGLVMPGVDGTGGWGGKP